MKPVASVSQCCCLSVLVLTLIRSPQGINLSAEQILTGVKEYFEVQAVEGWAGLMTFINAAKATPGLRWAAPLEVKTSAEKVFTEKFGAKETAASSKSKAKVRIHS